MNFLKNSSINPPVFFTAAILILIIVASAIFQPEFTQSVFNNTQAWILEHVSWFYILAVAIILITTVLVAISRFGDIKLGPDHATPEYKDFAWFAMLFSTGMGIGLMFFGVAEPVMHFLSPPIGEGGTVDAARNAMNITYFHWGLHAWSIYAIVGLVLAFFCYRHELPLKLSSALYPMIGDKIYGPIGKAVDIFAVLGTVFGIATTLGFGVSQINSGLNYLFNIPVGTQVQIVLIVVACGLATISVASGLDRGIKFLSEANLILAALLLLFVLILGPTVLIFKTFVENTGIYLADLVPTTFKLYAYEPTDWIGGWTLFYWGWWISWSPFVGLFIARISRGRTIRQFVMGVLLVPSGFTLFWMTTFGDTSIFYILAEGMTDFGEIVQNDVTQALFVFLEYMPLSTITSVVALLMVIIFFVTSADSGALVLDLLSSKDNAPSPVWQRIFWSSLTGVVAIALLLADGLQALQTATIASALPFSVILLLAIYGLIKALRTEATKRRIRFETIARGQHMPQDQDWQKRLRNMVVLPEQSHVVRFINLQVAPAMKSVTEELASLGFETEVRQDLSEAGDSEGWTLEVKHHGEYQNFVYSVRPIAENRPNLTTSESKRTDKTIYYRAEVYLKEGGQDYDIMGWSEESIIADILDQYERHRHFIHMVYDNEEVPTEEVPNT